MSSIQREYSATVLSPARCSGGEGGCLVAALNLAPDTLIHGLLRIARVARVSTTEAMCTPLKRHTEIRHELCCQKGREN